MPFDERNYRGIQEDVALACARAGRDPAGVLIIAVSKTLDDAELARALPQALACGVRSFAENRSAAFKARQQAHPEADWHFIGAIQTNKAKDFAGRAKLVHSVASERALSFIDRHAFAAQRVQDLLIEVNISGEASKSGIAPRELPAMLEAAESRPNVCVRGLMTMAPLGDPACSRKVFAELRELRDNMRPHYEGSKQVQLAELSMGMTDDYVIAVEEGATMVRIGRKMWQAANR